MRILCAMSGGVDSSVAAGLLCEAGHEVVGVTLHLYDSGPERRVGRCCAAADQEDARRAAAHLGIRHYTLDYRDLFESRVVSDFVQSYAQGETPTPCTHCNAEVKFGPLFATAMGLGAERLATGHYARVTTGGEGRHRLLRGRDLAKDQSYFLFPLSQEVLGKTLFPLGELTKTEVRAHARRLGLPNAGKPESMEVCFVEGVSVGRFVEGRLAAPPAAGDVVDGEGRRIGGHPGVHHFTVGQRRGLPIAGDGRPRYVVSIDPGRSTILIGDAAALERMEIEARRVHWVAGAAPPAGEPLGVQVRHRSAAAEARVTAREDDRALIRFAAPIRAVASGQAAVFYAGDEVLGGGWIESAR